RPLALDAACLMPAPPFGKRPRAGSNLLASAGRWRYAEIACFAGTEDVMRRLCGIAVVCLALAPAAGWTDEPRRPNVRGIVADGHAPYVCGAYGNKAVRTPNLDRLAADGMRFDRAYCNSPVCTASRQSFLTGRYPRTIGVTQLQTPLPENETTLAELLKAAGYETAAIGKMHFNSNLKHG